MRLDQELLLWTLEPLSQSVNLYNLSLISSMHVYCIETFALIYICFRGASDHI